MIILSYCLYSDQLSSPLFHFGVKRLAWILSFYEESFSEAKVKEASITSNNISLILLDFTSMLFNVMVVKRIILILSPMSLSVA